MIKNKKEIRYFRYPLQTIVISWEKAIILNK